MKRPHIYAKKLAPGMGVGVFTPSTPAHVMFREKYLHGLKVIGDLGFQVVEGELTKSCVSEGYRTASGKDRAAEFMSLIRNPNVHALVSTIGGLNSSSLIPYLDFDEIRASRKVICGYSDVTSLHIAILKYAGLRTFYGPAVMPSFGEWPTILSETKESFLTATMDAATKNRLLLPPKHWSNHFRDAATDKWKTEPRIFKQNYGWKVLQGGHIQSRLIVANLSTLSANAGTPYFPDLLGKALLIETMGGSIGTEERFLRQLERIGVLDVITALLIGKIEDYKPSGESLAHDDLIMEIVGPKRKFPIISGFDCSHTNPMLTLVEDCLISLNAKSDHDVELRIIEPMVE